MTLTVRGAFLQQLLGDIVPPTSARRLSGGVQGNTQGLPALDQEALSAVNLVAGAGFVPDSEHRAPHSRQVDLCTSYPREEQDAVRCTLIPQHPLRDDEEEPPHDNVARSMIGPQAPDYFRGRSRELIQA